MKNYTNCCMIAFLFLSFCNCSDKEKDNGGETILESLDATLSATKDSVTLKATRGNFVCFYAITSYQNGEPSTQLFDSTTELKSTSGNWFRIESINPQFGEGMAGAIKIVVKKNDSNMERKLYISLWSYDLFNTLTVTQSAD